MSKKRIFLESMLNNFKQQKKKKKRNTHSHTLNNNTFFVGERSDLFKKKNKKRFEERRENLLKWSINKQVLQFFMKQIQRKQAKNGVLGLYKSY